MKRFNKFIALFLVVVMTAGLLVTGVSAATEDNTSNDSIILVEDFEVGENGSFVEVKRDEVVGSVRNDKVYDVKWNGAEPNASKIEENIFDYYMSNNKGVGVTLTANVEGGYLGSKCVSHEYSGAYNSRLYLYYQLYNDEVANNKLQPGETYTASIWFKQAAGGGKGIIRVKDTNSKSDNPIEVSAEQTTTSESWQKVEVDFEYFEGARIRIQIELTNANSKLEANEWVTYFDHLVVEKKEQYKEMTYADLTDALAQEGTDPVELLSDVDGAGNDLVLKGKTLDLAGNTLTVDSLSALKGANVIDSVGGGKLVVAEGNLMLQKDNSDIPVAVDGGYAFVTVKPQQMVIEDGVEGTLCYKARPIVGSVDLMADGVADDGLTILIRLTWTNESNGTITTMDVPVADTLVSTIYGNSSNDAILLTVGGADSVENLKVATVIRSVTGVEFVTEALAYTVAQ